MKRLLSSLLIVILIAAAGYGVYYWQQTKVQGLTQQSSDLQTKLQKANETISKQPNYTYKSAKGVNITVYTPMAKAKLTSPVTIMGEVPGDWSFEGQFPVELNDATGKTVIKSPAMLQGDWTTTDLVPFSVTLKFNGQPSGAGTLILHKDNPSGLAANDDTLTIPVEF